MDKSAFSYVKTHTLLILGFVIVGFLVLAGGEFILYKKVDKINQMVAEGLMQVKEGKGVRPLVEPSQKPTMQLFK